jgi:Mg-chelatase subunit ChlD
MTRCGPRLKIALALVGIMTLSLDRAAEFAAPVARRPVTVMLVLDTSLSVRGPDFGSVGRAALALLDLLKDGDRAGLVTFSDRIRVHSAATPDIAMVRQRLGEAVTRGASLLPRSVVWDAVMAGAAAGTGTAPSPWIVLFSDGLDNASWLEQDALASTLASAGVTVDFVRVPQTRTLDEQDPGRQQPGDLAVATGGRVHSLTDRDLGRALQKRLGTLRGS